MPLIFAQTTATLAQEFVESVREDRLEFHLSRISDENGVVISKQESQYTVFGHWDAITIAYTSLSNILNDKNDSFRNIETSTTNTANNCLFDDNFQKPECTAWPLENSLNNADLKTRNNRFSYSSLNRKMFDAANSFELGDVCSNVTDLSKSSPNQDFTKVSMTIKNKSGRKPGSTVKSKDFNPPEPLTFIYSNSDDTGDSIVTGKHIKSTTVPPTKTENVETCLKTESYKSDNLDSESEAPSDSPTSSEKEDVLSPESEKEDVGPAINEIKVEKEDNFVDNYDAETDIEDQNLPVEENDSGVTNSNLQKQCDAESSKSKENQGKISIEGQKSINCKEFKCLLCPYVGKKKINLRDHMLKHRVNYTCEVCSKTFGVKKDYVRHCDKHNKVKKPKVKKPKKKKKPQSEYACDACSYVTSTRDNLKDHIKRTHIKKFTCSVCEKPFGSRRDVNRHRNYVHGEPRYFCDICKKPYKSSRTYNEHLKTHEEGYIKPEFPCDVCNKSFSTKYVLNQHVKVEHLGVRKAYMCPTCGRSFTQKASYHAHATVHLGIKPYVCDICDIIQRYMNVAVATENGLMTSIVKLGRFKGKAFSYEKSLREHKYIHETINRFQCQFCEKGFKQSTSLKLHLRVHAGARDYMCMTCGKGFTQKQALERHERIHSGSKPYLCSLCNKTFNDTSIIRRHMILVHKKHSDRWREGVVHTEKKRMSEDHHFYISQIKEKTDENSTKSSQDNESTSSTTEFTSIDRLRWENPPIRFNFSEREFADRKYKEKTVLDAHNRCVSPTRIIEQEKLTLNLENTDSGVAAQSRTDMTYLNPDPLSNRGEMSSSHESGTQSNDYTSQMLRWNTNDYQSFYMNSVNQQ